MNIRSLLIILLVFFARPALAQKIIAAKDANRYGGKEVYVIGKIVNVAGPGYSRDMSIFVASDSTELGVSVVIPFKIWSKYENRKGLLAADVKGKKIKVYGRIERVAELDSFIRIRKAADIQIFSK
ncbi:hypothetical protein D0C36_06930 [Mucilaginibacter conchicola]|uniref:DNA-binding protein n=1 Tax=Mucilaginibacter conchicola TaxID=2303333 RepID=A0A372NYR7_9SPHI|nr:hypothetical protein [Mucilaginibacter conchicola]RFZ95255.1 hypothetical protein D0C36_06930 [Mucilaginibacter conchicola]